MTKHELADIQEESIGYYLKNKDSLIDDTIKQINSSDSDWYKTINVDDYRDYFPGYTGLNAAAVHEPSSALGKEMFTKMLDQEAGKPVLYLAGGAGSGKTSASKLAAGFNVDDYGFVMDGTLGSYDRAVSNFERVAELGGTNKVLYTFTDPLEAFKRSIDRTLGLAKKGESPRVVPIGVFFDGHNKSLKTAKRLSDEGFDIDIIDNSGPFGTAHFVESDEIADVSYDVLKLIDQGNDYLTKLYDEGKIERELYEAISERTPSVARTN